jgi:S-adenosylmethionine:tRNA ribosyltransferase-isomerase
VEPDQSLFAYDYELPPEQIAQNPAVPRDSSRLLVVKDRTQHAHAIFRDLPNLLQLGDLLILNDTRVLPARLYGRKSSGLPVEVLLLEPRPQEQDEPGLSCPHWLVLVKPGRRLKPGARIFFGETSPVAQAGELADGNPGMLTATVVETDQPTGGRILRFDAPPGQALESWFYQLGQVPLPPYITQSETRPEQYQTVYARTPGAVAAPTAGLHFTPELLQRLTDVGIQLGWITLHVGVGTFRPVESEDITAHQMHAEWIEVSPAVVEQIQQTKARGGRVIAVGTTVVRSLEGAAQTGSLQPTQGKTNLYIYPGYQWQVIDGMITNFHLPKSSLMMLVSALIGRQRLLDLYQVAIAEGYRFYSFGDAMLILPEARIAWG